MTFKLIDVVSLAKMKSVITFYKFRAYYRFSLRTSPFCDSTSPTVVEHGFLIRHDCADEISVKARGKVT